jgi:hypothetical protein
MQDPFRIKQHPSKFYFLKSLLCFPYTFKFYFLKSLYCFPYLWNSLFLSLFLGKVFSKIFLLEKRLNEYPYGFFILHLSTNYQNFYHNHHLSTLLLLFPNPLFRSLLPLLPLENYQEILDMIIHYMNI